MEPRMILDEAARRLRDWIERKPDEVRAQKDALDYYGKYFAPPNLSSVTVDGFKEFLLFKHNKHWSGIHRRPEIYADMERLRQCLAILLDEREGIESRLDRLIPPDRPRFIKGLDRAVLTPILMCVYPDKYAVYNRISDEALRWLGRNPVKRTDSFAKRYVALNRVCREIASEIQQPLWLVDSMFSLMVHGVESPLHGVTTDGAGGLMAGEEPREPLDTAVPDAEESLAFSLERYLRDFIASNWEKTPLGKTLALHEEDGEFAVEFPTDVGRIDILARDKARRDWVVVELKKGVESDRAVGQLLRYMGWVKKHRATENEEVRGIIIAGQPDDRIRYAVSVCPTVSFCTYRVSFELVEESSV